MFIRPALSEMLVIGRGLLVLTIAILIGVSVAEQQLTTLTQRRDDVEAFNVKRNIDNTYSFYMLGESLTIRAVYPVLRIINNDDGFAIEAAGRKVEIPGYIHAASYDISTMYSLWHRQFIGEAFKFKSDLERYAKEAAREVHNYFLEDK